MFDVAFSELLVIAVVALLVVGPEKLPQVARTLGKFLGRMQSMMQNAKNELMRGETAQEFKNLQNDWQSVHHQLTQEATKLHHTLEETRPDDDFCGPMPKK